MSTTSTIQRVLLTGGAGYIGSNLAAELIMAGHDVTIVDNFTTSSEAVVGVLTGLAEQAPGTLSVFPVDICDEQALRACLTCCTPDAVVHLAGLKSVGESARVPLHYYQQNVAGTLTLLRAMQAIGIFKLIFSSSATVYGNPLKLPISEDHPCVPINPYGRSKRMVEDILQDVSVSHDAWQVVCLRYFNPVGGHDIWPLGDSPMGPPANLFPLVAQAAGGIRNTVPILGNDYPTKDGTGVRDYIHIMDLVNGHIAALRNLDNLQSRFMCINLGTGEGHSVMEVLEAFRTITGHTIPHDIYPRRVGDVPVCYADASLAKQELGWTATRGLEEMCASAWRHFSAARPHGIFIRPQ